MDTYTPRFFDILRSYDIRAARTSLVDSAEAAIAFAERRNAPDPRSVPILLFDVSRRITSEDWNMPLKSVPQIRESYARHYSDGPPHIVVQESVDKGETVTITAQRRENRPMICIASRRHMAEASLPLGGTNARTMASTYEAFGHRTSGEKRRRMLADLLERVSHFYSEQSQVNTLQLFIRLHENEYTVVDGLCTPPAKPLHERLGRHAHDRWEYGYKPSGKGPGEFRRPLHRRPPK